MLVPIRGSNIETSQNDMGKPTWNGADKRFKRRLRCERLNNEWFRSRQEAWVMNEPAVHNARRIPPAARKIL